MPDSLTEISIPLLSRRRERLRLAQKIQHALPAFVLIVAGAHGLLQGERGPGLVLAWSELAVSLPLLFTLAKEIAAARRPGKHSGHHHGVDWYEIFAAGVLAVESLEHWHTHEHLPRPKLVFAVFTLAMGLFHGRLAAFTASRRILRINAAGILIGGQFFRQFFAPWKEIERIDLDDRKARLVLRGGRKWRINLADLRNAPEVRQALLAAQRLVPVTQGAGLPAPSPESAGPVASRTTS